MKQKRNVIKGLLLYAALTPLGVFAQNEKPTKKEIESNVVRIYFAENRENTESSRLEYLIPNAYYMAYPARMGYNLDLFKKIETLRSYYPQEYTPDSTPEIPEQFKIQKVISGEEQERKIEEEAAEKLYKEQSDPMYFENSKASFQEEFNRRMQQRSLKK